MEELYTKLRTVFEMKKKTVCSSRLCSVTIRSEGEDESFVESTPYQQ